MYKDPEAFNPERFFDKDGNLNDDDSGYTFGFGRRLVLQATNPRKRTNLDLRNPGYVQACTWDVQLSVMILYMSLECPSLTSEFQVWLSIATILWAFNIGKAKDPLGHEIPISGEYSDGMIR